MGTLCVIDREPRPIHHEQIEEYSTQIQPIGLIINELATNAAKAGAAQIWVGLNRNGKGTLALTVTDDGPGLTPSFTPGESAGGLGMKLVRILSGQLRGTVEAVNRSTGRGACFKITFFPS